MYIDMVFLMTTRKMKYFILYYIKQFNQSLKLLTLYTENNVINIMIERVN